MNIRISTTDSAPIYQQIKSQIQFLVAAGRMLPGEELPPIRTLAEELLVNPNTVARAYRELQAEGLLENHRTAGTFVCQQLPVVGRTELLRHLEDPADRLLTAGKQLGLSIDEVTNYLLSRHQALSDLDGGD